MRSYDLGRDWLAAVTGGCGGDARIGDMNGGTDNGAGAGGLGGGAYGPRSDANASGATVEYGGSAAKASSGGSRLR